MLEGTLSRAVLHIASSATSYKSRTGEQIVPVLVKETVLMYSVFVSFKEQNLVFAQMH